MVTKLTPSVSYIGCDDIGLDLFENQYRVPEGMSYNSYIIDDDKLAVLDTCDVRTGQEWLSNLRTALKGRTPDYLIVHHLEPDHSAMIARVLSDYPEMKIVASAIAVRMLPQFFDGVDFTGRTVTVADGDSLELGAHKLQFIMAPMIHWPEVMMTYDATEGMLFSADAFGKFGALSRTGGLREVSLQVWRSEARRYYFNICGKYGPQVQKLLKRASELEIKQICPLHGPVLDSGSAGALKLYDTWSSYASETEGVLIAYASIHGGTAQAAERLARMLEQAGVKISLRDLCRCGLSYAVSDAFRFDRVVLAASSYDAGLFPPMYDFLHHLQIKNWQKRKVAVIENGSWAPTAGKVMTDMLASMKEIELIGDKVTIRSRLHESDIPALEALAGAIRGI